MKILLIIFVVLAIGALVAQFLLYKDTSLKTEKIIFAANALLGILISFLAYSALASNYIGAKVVAGSWGLVTIISVILRLSSKGTDMIRRILLSISVIGGLIQLLFF